MSQSKQLGTLPAGQVPNTASNGVVLPLLLTIPIVAAKLGVSRPTIYKMIYSKGLPYIKLGRCMRVSAVSLERWLEEREHQRRG